MSEGATNNGASSNTGKAAPEVPKSDADLINDLLKQGGESTDAELDAQKRKIIEDINKYLEKKKQNEKPKEPAPVAPAKQPEPAATETKAAEPEKPAAEA